MLNNKLPQAVDFKLLIEERIKNFWGYGNFNGDIWFVGMEEGFSGTNEVLKSRLEETSGGEIFDIYSDLTSDPDHRAWFEEGARTQSTYRKLIYLLLYFKNKTDSSLEERREYQIKQFGRKTANHAVLELMPLPAKSTKNKDWLYAESGVVGLATRKEYLETYVPRRIEKLRELIGKYKPKVVVFYSFQYQHYWKDITTIQFKEVIPNKLYTAKNHNTVYAVVRHPVARGSSYKDWKDFAEVISESTHL